MMNKFFIIIVLAFISCGSDDYAPKGQEILLSFPELSAMTVGQTYPYVVSLNIPAIGISLTDGHRR